MAKKSTSQKIEERSVRSNANALIGFSACIALILSVAIFVINFILGLFNADLGTIMTILVLIKDIALGIAIGLSSYYYARNKKKGFKITVYVCMILYVIFAIVCNVWSLF